MTVEFHAPTRPAEKLAPQEQVAQLFMKHKGYGDIKPFDVEKLDEEPCWYFMYALTEGVLELEVYWNGEDWETTVTTFEVGDPI